MVVAHCREAEMPVDPKALRRFKQHRSRVRVETSEEVEGKVFQQIGAQNVKRGSLSELLKIAAPRWVKEVRRGNLSPQAVQRIARESMQPGQVRQIRELGHGNANLADHVVANLGPSAQGHLVRKLPVRKLDNPSLRDHYTPLVQASRDIETVAGPGRVAPYVHAGPQGGMQELDLPKPLTSNPLRRMNSNADALERVGIGDLRDQHGVLRDANFGPTGRAVDWAGGNYGGAADLEASLFAVHPLTGNAAYRTGVDGKPLGNLYKNPLTTQQKNTVRRHWLGAPATTEQTPTAVAPVMTGTNMPPRQPWSSIRSWSSWPSGPSQSSSQPPVPTDTAAYIPGLSQQSTALAPTQAPAAIPAATKSLPSLPRTTSVPTTSPQSNPTPVAQAPVPASNPNPVTPKSRARHLMNLLRPVTVGAGAGLAANELTKESEAIQSARAAYHLDAQEDWAAKSVLPALEALEDLDRGPQGLLTLRKQAGWRGVLCAALGMEGDDGPATNGGGIGERTAAGERLVRRIGGGELSGSGREWGEVEKSGGLGNLRTGVQVEGRRQPSAPPPRAFLFKASHAAQDEFSRSGIASLGPNAAAGQPGTGKRANAAPPPLPPAPGAPPQEPPPPPGAWKPSVVAQVADPNSQWGVILQRQFPTPPAPPAQAQAPTQPAAPQGSVPGAPPAAGQPAPPQGSVPGV